jgi:hypothetical protein
MTIFERLAERRIMEAQRDGSFDRLPGRGRRLELEDDPAVPPEWRAAFRLLKNAGLAPDWLGQGHEIEEERARLLSFLAEEPLVDQAHLAAIATLNRRIDDFNLVVPHASLQKPRLKVGRIGEREA